jgi:hypothetical protein
MQDIWWAFAADWTARIWRQQCRAKLQLLVESRGFVKASYSLDQFGKIALAVKMRGMIGCKYGNMATLTI